MQPSTLYYRDVLRTELARRTRKNPRYSLRAFARSLEVDATALWRILTGRRSLSLATARKVTDKLGCTAEAKRLFLASVAEERAGKELETAPPAPAVSINDKLFTIVADWHHYAILELTYVEGVKDDPDWIAKALGIAPAEARAALARLLAVGLLVEKDGRLVKAERRVHAATPQGTTEALKRHQRQLLAKAADAVDAPPASRAFTTLVLPTDPALVETARKMLEDFAWQLCRHLTGGRMTDVYALTLGIFPLQRREKP